MSTRDSCLFLNHCGDMAVLLGAGKGGVIFAPGEPARYVYHIHTGVAALVATSPSGQEALISIGLPSQLVGIAGVFAACRPGDGVHFCQARAITPVVYCKVKREAFLDLLADPVTRAKIIDLLCSRISTLSLLRPFPERHDILKRVMVVLHLLAESVGYKEAEDRSAVCRITHDDIALLAGTTRSSVERALNELRRKGLVETYRQKIVISGLKSPWEFFGLSRRPVVYG